MERHSREHSSHRSRRERNDDRRDEDRMSRGVRDRAEHRSGGSKSRHERSARSSDRHKKSRGDDPRSRRESCKSSKRKSRKRWVSSSNLRHLLKCFQVLYNVYFFLGSHPHRRRQPRQTLASPAMVHSRTLPRTLQSCWKSCRSSGRNKWRIVNARRN